MTAEIKSIQGFGFEDLHFFDHALVLYPYSRKTSSFRARI